VAAKNGRIQEGLLPSGTNSNSGQPIACSESHSSGVDPEVEGSAHEEETTGAGSVRISSSPAQQVGPPPQTPPHGVGSENEGGSRGDVNVEDRESSSDTRAPVLGDSTMINADARTMSGPQEGHPGRDVRMEDGESWPEPKTTAPELEDKGGSGGDAMMSTDKSASAPEDKGDSDGDEQMEDGEGRPEASAPAMGPRPPIHPSHEVRPEYEGGSTGDVSMEDGERHPEMRTPVLGPEDKGDSGGNGRSVDARTAPEPEDEGHSCHDGPEDQGDPDVTMANGESGDDSASNDPQNPAGPIETRSSHRLREAAIGAPAGDPPTVPEGELDEDDRKTPAGSRRGNKKEPAPRQKPTPSIPLGLWEIIDVDSLVRCCNAVNLIGLDVSFRKTETLLTLTSRNSHRKLRETCRSLAMTEWV